MKRHDLAWTPLSPSRVDSESGIIYGVSILTVGLARGHDLEVDQTTLRQMLDCADKMGTVPVKWNHKSGADAVAGYLKNFRIEGDKLKGDWHLLKNHSQFAQAIEMAERMPQNIGLSAAFLGKDETCKGRTCARCSELISVDLVAQPAANPNGLFSARFSVGENPKSSKSSKSRLAVPLMAGAAALIGARLGMKAALVSKYRRVGAGENLAGKIVAVGKKSGGGILHVGVADAKGGVSHLSPGHSRVRREKLGAFAGEHDLFVERGGRRVDTSKIRPNSEGIGQWSVLRNCEHAASKMSGRKPSSPQLRGALIGAAAGGAAVPLAAAGMDRKKKDFAASEEHVGTFVNVAGEKRRMRFTTSRANLKKSEPVKVYDVEAEEMRTITPSTLVGKLRRVKVSRQSAKRPDAEKVAGPEELSDKAFAGDIASITASIKTFASRYSGSVRRF